MNVRIGITQSPRELDIDLGDDADPDQVAKDITDALGEDGSLFWLTDRKGKRFGIVAAKVSYVEFGAESEERAVGFKA